MARQLAGRAERGLDARVRGCGRSLRVEQLQRRRGDLDAVEVVEQRLEREQLAPELALRETSRSSARAQLVAVARAASRTPAA